MTSDAWWILLTLGLAGVSSRMVCRRLVRQWPMNLMIGVLLFVVFLFMPIHLLAMLELLGVIRSIVFAWIFGLEASLGLALWIILGRYVHAEASDKRLRVSSSLKEWPTYLKILLLVLAASGAIFFIDVLTSFPSGWDALSYHLPVSVRWLQERSLDIPRAGNWRYCLPGNGEIGTMLLLGLGWQRGATFFNLLAFSLSAAAVYLFAFRLVRKGTPALLSAMLFSSLPVVQFQTFSGYVDLYGTSFVLAGLAIFLSRRDRRPTESGSVWYTAMTFLSGCALGIAIGTKPTFYIYAGPCLVGMSWIIWREREWHRRPVGCLLALLAIGGLLPSFYWFMRALFRSGNPFYPLEVNVFGVILFKGLRTTDITPAFYADLNFVRSKLEWVFYPWVEYKRSGYNFSVDGGLGAAWATFVPLGIGYAIYLTLRNIKKKEFLLWRVSMGSLFVGGVVWWLFLLRVPRFGIPLLAVASILTAPLFELLLERQLKLLQSLMLTSILLTSLLTVLIPVHSFLGRARTNAWNRAAVYGYPSVIDRLPRGATVLNLGAPDTMNFPLAGEHLTNRVLPVDWVSSVSVSGFIDRAGVDFIVGVHPFSAGEWSEDRVRLIFEGKIGEALWRIWKVTERSRG